MAAGSHVTIEIDVERPADYSRRARDRSPEQVRRACRRTENTSLPEVEFGREITEDLRDLIFDPQTSGGLLLSVAAESADGVLADLKKAGISAVFVGIVDQPQRQDTNSGNYRQKSTACTLGTPGTLRHPRHPLSP